LEPKGNSISSTTSNQPCSLKGRKILGTSLTKSARSRGPHDKHGKNETGERGKSKGKKDLRRGESQKPETDLCWGASNTHGGPKLKEEKGAARERLQPNNQGKNTGEGNRTSGDAVTTEVERSRRAQSHPQAVTNSRQRMGAREVYRKRQRRSNRENGWLSGGYKAGPAPGDEEGKGNLDSRCSSSPETGWVPSSST